jgi:hypothetical protein
MRKKHAPAQYAAKPKIVAAKSSIRPSGHPALGVAKVLVSWMERAGVPPSIILLHGLHLARNPKNDGLPVDTYLPELQVRGTDNKVISAILDALPRPQADITQVIAAWRQSNWDKKSAKISRITSSNEKHKTCTVQNKPANLPRKAKESFSMKPVIEVKKKRSKIL